MPYQTCLSWSWDLSWAMELLMMLWAWVRTYVKQIRVCDEVFESSGRLDKHMSLHGKIIQLDGNVNVSENSNDTITNSNIKLNEYQTRDPNNPHDGPYFYCDEELDEFYIKCKICGEVCDGKSFYNGHVNVYHPCDICLTNSVGIHYCPYRDFMIVWYFYISYSENIYMLLPEL